MQFTRMYGEGYVKGIRRIVGRWRRKGTILQERRLLVKDGGGEWNLHPVVCECQCSDLSIVENLPKLRCGDEACRPDKCSGGVNRKAGLDKGC